MGRTFQNISRGNQMKDLDALRMAEGLVRNTHQTLESITERMRTPIYEPIVRECIDSSYMPEGISLD